MGSQLTMKPLYLASSIFFAFIIVCLLFPVFHLVWLGVQSINVETLGLIPLRLVWFTCLQALISAVLSGVLGISFALACYETDFWGKKLIIRFSEVTFFLPTLLVTLALIGVWGNRGWLGQMFPWLNFYGWFAVLLAHIFFNYSVFFKNVGQSLKEMDRTEEKIALSLGTTKWTTFCKVSLVKLRSSILQSFSIVFLYCSASFFVILILGGGPRFSTLETAIYQAIKVDLNIPLAVCLAMIQICICLLAQVFYNPQSPPRLSAESRHSERVYNLNSDGLRKFVFWGVWIVSALLVLIPVINLVVSGLGGFFKLDVSDLFQPLLLSFIVGVQVSLLTSFIALSAAYIHKHTNLPWVRRTVSFICTLPVALSTMVFGLSLILVLSTSLQWMQDKWVGVIIVQTLSALPMSFRILSESFSKLEQEIYRSAESLGTGKFQQLFLLEIPAVKKSIALAMATSFGISIGEAGAVLLFESQGKTTLSLWLFKLIGKYQFEEAQGVGLILLLFMLLIFTMKEKWENLR